MRTRERNATRASASEIIACGLGMAAACAILARSVIMPAHSETWALQQSLDVGAVLLALYSYWHGYRLLDSSANGATRAVVIVASGLAFLNAALPPFSSNDVYAYVSQGWEQYHYHLNPYLRNVRSIAGAQHDPMLCEWFKQDLCAYGFLFARLESLLARLGDGNLYLTMLLFKMTDLVAYAANAWLIFVIGTRLNIKRVDLALYLYLWNPMILIHQLSNGHNDLLMAVFVMLAIYFAVIELWPLVLPAIVVGLLVKWIAGVVLPFAFVFVARKKGFATAAASFLIALGFGGAAGSLYFAGWSQAQFVWLLQPVIWQMYSVDSALIWSLMAIQKFVPLGISFAAANAVVAPVLAGAVAMLVLYQFARFSMEGDHSLQDLIAVSLFAELAVVCVALGWFWPSHVGMFFPLAMLLKEGHWLRRLTIAFTLFQMEYFTYLDTFRILNSVFMLILPMLWVAWAQWPEVRKDLAGRWSVEHQPVMLAVSQEMQTNRPGN